MAMNDVWQVNAFYRDGASAAQTVRHWRVTEQVSEGDLAFSEAFLNKLGPLYQAVQAKTSTATAKLICLTCLKVSPTGSRTFVYFFANAPGTLSGEANAAQLAILLSLYTETPQPYARGRIYWPFPAESISVGGIMLETALGVLMTPINALFAPELTDAEDNKFVPVIWSRKTTQSYEITDYQMRPVLATQRPRQDPLQAFIP